MELSPYIIPLGIVTYALVLAAVITGIKRVDIKKHKLIAILAISFATAHALIIIYERFFNK